MKINPEEILTKYADKFDKGLEPLFRGEIDKERAQIIKAISSELREYLVTIAKLNKQLPLHIITQQEEDVKLTDLLMLIDDNPELKEKIEAKLDEIHDEKTKSE